MPLVSSPLRTRPGELGSGGPSLTETHQTARPTLFQRWFGQAASGPEPPTSFELTNASWTDAETPDEPPAPATQPQTATHLESLLGIAERLASTHNRTELLRVIVEETKVALRADYVTIRILDGDQLPVRAHAGIGAERASVQSICGESLRPATAAIARLLGKRACRRFE